MTRRSDVVYGRQGGRIVEWEDEKPAGPHKTPAAMHGGPLDGLTITLWSWGREPTALPYRFGLPSRPGAYQLDDTGAGYRWEPTR